jgi:hypothetical protein
MVRTSFLDRSGSKKLSKKYSKKGAIKLLKKSKRDNCHFSAEVNS